MYRVWMMCWAVKWRIILSLYWMVGILMDTWQIKQTVTPLVSVLTLPVTLMEDYHVCKYKDHMLLWVYITVFSVLMGYCSEHPVTIHTRVCACNSTSLAGLMALFLSCSIFVRGRDTTQKVGGWRGGGLRPSCPCLCQ